MPGTRGATPASRRRRNAALARLRGLYAAIARIPASPASATRRFTDVEQEINGLLTYDRKPKFDTKAVREINELLK